jgi:hypothetical protein
VADSDAHRRSRRRIVLIVVLTLALLVIGGWTIAVVGVDGKYLLGKPLAWRFTPRWAAFTALALVVLVLLCTHWAVRLSADTPEKPTAAHMDGMTDAGKARRITEFRRSGLKGLVVGVDGRASTSQVQVAIWSVALVAGLLLLLFVGRTPNCPDVLAGPHRGSCPASVVTGSFAERLGHGFRWEYLLLLGWPIALALAAKRQVLRALDEIDARTGAVEDPAMPKAGSPEALGTDPRAEVKTPSTDADSMGVVAGLRDVVSDDHGRGALLDAQYFAFTSVTVAYFALQITSHPADGLPQIPAALLVLMGIAGGGYISGKVLDPIGAKSERTVPPPPATPATTEAAAEVAAEVAAAPAPELAVRPARQEETVLIRRSPGEDRPPGPDDTAIIELAPPGDQP